MINPVQKSILTTKPIKMPKGLIYNHPKSTVYHLIETETWKEIGKIDAFNMQSKNIKIYDTDKRKELFYIASLFITPEKRNLGWGKYFMDFIKRESHKQGCEGRTFLIAHNQKKSPHIFYKKQEFITVDEEVNRELDEHIKNGTIPNQYEAMYMYLPPELFDKYKVEASPRPKKRLWDYINYL